MSNFIRVLRNGTLYSTREIAKTNLETQLGKLQDGEICLASYGASWDKAKTILGVVRTKGATPSYTIFDNEDIAGIVATIQELDATVRGNLNENDVIQTGKHVGVKVVEVDGKLTEVKVVESDIASAKLLGTTDDTAGTGTAFARIAKEAADRAKAITDAINGLGSSVAATNDGLHVLTGVTQANGVLSNKTEIQLANVAISGSAAHVATTAIGGDTTHVAVAGENVSAQITDIAKTLKGVKDSIDEAKANDLKYITVKLSDTETSALGANVKEAYQVFAYTGTWDATSNKGTEVGDTIKIYKDANVKEIYLGSSKDKIGSDGTITKVPEKDIVEAELSLNYAYVKADGTYEMASIPVGSFLRESEFKNGLQVAGNGEVSVKVDGASEGDFLSVSGAGVKISGVQDAIDAAIGKLNTTVASTGDNNVTVTVTEAAGKITGVTVSTPGLALERDVVKAVTVNGVNATVTSNKADVTIDGTDIAVANSTETYEPTVYSAPFEGKVTEGDYHIATGDTVAAAFKKTENTISVLATEVISNEKVTTAAITELAKSAGVTNTDGVIGYQKKTDANYIGAATSVHDATVKLDAAIKTVEGNANSALTEVQGSNAITVSTKAEKKQTVSLKLDSVKTDNALTVTDNGLYLSNVWDCGEY